MHAIGYTIFSADPQTYYCTFFVSCGFYAAPTPTTLKPSPLPTHGTTSTESGEETEHGEMKKSKEPMVQPNEI